MSSKVVVKNMKIKDNANEILKSFVESERVIRVYDSLKIGIEKDNLVIVDTFLQNLLNQLFLELPKTIELEDSDFKDNNPKTESIKKFVSGADKRFGVGLDLVCNYILKNKKLWFNFQGLSVNENANAIKFLSLLKDDERGTSIIIVTIVMAVIAFISLSLLLVSYQMISASNDDITTDRYYRQAESFSKVLQMRLNSGKKTNPNSIEAFIYEFMSDDKSYPATAETASNVEFDADSPEGDGGEKYCGMNIKLKKELASGREDEVSENGWSERREYYFTMRVNAIADGEKVSGITQKHLFYLADTSYNYYTEVSGADPINYKLDPEDNEFLLVEDGGEKVKVRLSELMEKKGVYQKKDGTSIIIKRELNKSNTTYMFEFLGWS